MNFGEFNIPLAVAEELTYSVDYGKFPHAAILEGLSEKARLDIAKNIAAALVCRGDDSKPCGKCAPCRKALGGTHPDIENYSERDHAEKRKTKVFAVETVRDIKLSVGILPNEADVKVYILENADLMNANAQNALLKVLEEPPKYAYFILLCSTRAGFLDTIISRARLFALGEPEDADKHSGKAIEAAVEFCRTVAEGNDFDTLCAASVFDKQKAFLEEALPVMEEIFVEAMKVKGGAVYSGEYGNVPALLASKLTSERLFTLKSRVRTIAASIKANGNYNLILTRLCAFMRMD